jgi:hypothetical protein
MSVEVRKLTGPFFPTYGFGGAAGTEETAAAFLASFSSAGAFGALVVYFAFVGGFLTIAFGNNGFVECANGGRISDPVISSGPVSSSSSSGFSSCAST